MDDTVWESTIPNLSGLLGPIDFRRGMRGGYSTVYKSQWNDDVVRVAVKVLASVQGVSLGSVRRKVRREGLIWANLNHPNILPLLGFVDDDEWFKPFGAFVSPWALYGNSEQYLELAGDYMNFSQRAELLCEAIKGAEYLHTYDPPIIHGDIKPANILIDQFGTPKLCDFGLSRIFLSEGETGLTTTTLHTGTERYLAPELVKSNEDAIPTRKSDVYAMGCVSLKFLFSRNAYHHRRNNAFGQIFQDIREGVPPENFQENIYAEYRIFVTIIESTWRQTPSLRPDMTILLTWLEHAISGKEGYMQGSYATNKFYVQQARRKSSDRSLESLLTGGLLQGTFRICLTSNIRDYNLQEVIKRALDATRVDGFHYLDVDKEFARLEVILEDSHVCFKILNSAASYLGLSCIPSRVCQEHVKSTVRVVQAAARFDRYLRLTPKIRPFQDGVQMEFTQVKSLGRLSMHSLPIYEGVGINLCKGNQVRIPDQEGLYGLKIINHSRYDFYVHLFRFNPSNFSIDILSIFNITSICRTSL
ncbi:kinase-like protein [Serendipita vermifera]|nr:kinase-like protein [Serendipita vermifera]